MGLEDIESSTYRNLENSKLFYEKGGKDMLLRLSKDLHKNLGVFFPSNSYSALLAKIQGLFSEKSSINFIHSIECKAYDLYNLIKDSEKILSLSEQGLQSQGKLRLKNFKFNVKVLKSGSLTEEKKNISEVFKDIYDLQLDNAVLHYISVIKQRLSEPPETLCSTEDYFTYEEPKVDYADYTDSFDNIVVVQNMNTEDIITSRMQRQQKKIIEDKEWEVQEAVNLKEKCRNKHKKLKIKQTELIEQEKVMKKKTLDIEKERHELDRLKDAYYREKKKISSVSELKSRKLCEVISNLKQNFETFETMGKNSPITDMDMLSDISYMSDSDMSFDGSMQETDPSVLQKRICELEGQYKSLKTPDSQEKIQREIDSLRNGLTKIRGSNALKSSILNQKKFSGVRSNYHSMTESSLSLKKTTSCGLSIFTPKSRPSYAPICDPLRSSYTPKSASHGITFNFNEIFPKESDEENKELRKFLRAQEIKLKEKEEKLEKERDRIMMNWMKLPNANELIPLVQREMMEYKTRSEETEKKMREYERRELELGVKSEEFKKKEGDIDRKLKELTDLKEKLDEERTSVVQKLEKLKEELERQ